MNQIKILDQNTIDKIAAGAVVERPASVVKELTENAIDAGATRITIEIKDGGIEMIRITDDGRGIAEDEIRLAFFRHATSKITSVDDLSQLSSLGFRGEALSSIAAVSRTELIAKQEDALTAIRYVIEGGRERVFEEIGAPDGTTIVVRDLFYNTPARAKFLKTAMTEAAHVGAYVEQLILSNPSVAFSYIVNGQVKADSTGTGSLADAVYHIYGRELSSELIETDSTENGISVSGLIGKPSVSRGNRNFENYYVNGRYVKSRVLSSAIEDGYGNKLMQHQYPFTCLQICTDGATVDVNVHPTKMEVRFSDERAVYAAVLHSIEKALQNQEMIIRASLNPPVSRQKPSFSYGKGTSVPQPFEKKALRETPPETKEAESHEHSETEPQEHSESMHIPAAEPEQLSFLPKFLSPEAEPLRKIIGVAFNTYWIVEYQEQLFLIDQHAAHEKVLFTRLMSDYGKSRVSSQQLDPPVIFSASLKEQSILESYLPAFYKIGFEIEPFGGSEYRISAVPYHLSAIGSRELFISLLDHLEEDKETRDLEIYVKRIATEACKAAVKGGDRISLPEARHLIDELFLCEDPYHCPHGRPTIISFTKTELEKKFKRIV